MYKLLLLSLATYGVSKLITDYDGAFDIFYKLRGKYKALTCTVCVSVWVATILSIVLFLGGFWLLTVLAVIGAVIFVEQKL